MKKTFILILIFIILINSFATAFADVVVLPALGIKVAITILASMGILIYIDNNGGVEQFYEDFLEWTETVKQINNANQLLVDLALQQFYTNTKMKVSKVSNLLKEFYYSYFSFEGIDFEEFPTIANPIISTYNQLKLKAGDITNYPIMNVGGYYRNIIETIQLGNGYELKIGLSFRAQVGITVVYSIFYNDEQININGKDYINLGNNLFGSNNIKIETRFEANQEESCLGVRIIDITQNTKQYIQWNGIIPPLVGNLGYLRIGVDVAPQSLPVPYGLTFPWPLSLPKSISAYFGDTIDNLIEDIANISLDTFKESVIDLPKAILDSIPVPRVIVDENDIVTDIEVPDIPDSTPDSKEQTGILGSILAFLKSIFDIPDDIKLDLEPLKNLIPKEKFPFCLPWDLANILNMFKSEPKAPEWKITILGNTFELKLSQFEQWARISRNILSATYVVILIYSTKKIVGGGS